MAAVPVDAGFDADGHGRSYWVDYLVDAISPRMAAATCPPMFSPYTFLTDADPKAYLMKKSVNMPYGHRKQTLFRVRCTYETDGSGDAVTGPAGSGGGGRGAANRRRRQDPLSRPAEITDHANTFSTVAWLDVYGNPILNGARMPFDPPVERDDARLVITITKNRAARLNSINVINHINRDPFLGAPAETLKIQEVQQNNEFEEFGDNPPIYYEYWRTSVSLEYKREGWRTKTLNAGRYQLITAFGQQFVAPITEGLKRGATPVADPWPLTAAGAAIPAASLPAAANAITTEHYPKLAFGSLGLI